MRSIWLTGRFFCGHLRWVSQSFIGCLLPISYWSFSPKVEFAPNYGEIKVFSRSQYLRRWCTACLKFVSKIIYFDIHRFFFFQNLNGNNSANWSEIWDANFGRCSSIGWNALERVFCAIQKPRPLYMWHIWCAPRTKKMKLLHLTSDSEIRFWCSDAHLLGYLKLFEAFVDRWKWCAKEQFEL